MTEQVNPETVAAGSDDDDVSALVADAMQETEPEVDSDNEESDDEESDEIVNGLKLDDLPEQIRDFITGVIVTKANDAVKRFTEANDLIASTLDAGKVAQEKFSLESPEEWIRKAREEYDRLHAEADKIATEATEKIKAAMSTNVTEEDVKNAVEKRKNARGDYEAQAKFANEQLLEPAGITGDVRALFETLPRAVGASTGGGGGQGSGAPKPRVGKVLLKSSPNGEFSPVTMTVTDSKGKSVKRSNFTALKQKLAAITGKTVNMSELHKAWYDVAGTTNWQEIKEPFDFAVPGKGDESLTVRVIPAAA